MTIIKNRTEIAFFYDIRDCNPNGDPLAENRPRIDEEVGACYVTDVRLKRNIRDYLRDYKAQTILIDDVDKPDGTVKTAKERADDFITKNKSSDPQELLLDNCIDARIFGCAIPLGTGNRSIQVTGPVQFNFGRSVHKVDDVLLQGTAAFASKSGKSQKSFREEYILHYALIRFYGIVNENLAKISKATEKDLDLMINAIWEGTASLQSRSKIGHMPRFLITIEYNEHNYMIGQIDKLISVKPKDQNISEKAIRDINEFEFDFTSLTSEISKVKEKIASIGLKIDSSIPNNLKSTFTNMGIVVKDL